VAEAEEAEVTEEAAAVELVIPEAEEAVEAELVEAAEEIIAAEEPALAEEPPAEEAQPEAEELPAEEVLLPGLEVPIDDLSTPLVPTQPEIKPKPEKKVVVVARTGPAEEEVDRDDAAGRSHKGKQLVFDEDHGRVVVKRKRKGSRRRPEWEQIDDLDPDF
jgi:hypothetical protein